MDKSAVITGLVGGILLAGVMGSITWVLSRDQTASLAEDVTLIEQVITQALEKERERNNLQQNNIITRLDSMAESQQEFRVETRGNLERVDTQVNQMLQALVTMAGGNNQN